MNRDQIIARGPPAPLRKFAIGVAAGMVGAVTIWLYELVVWVHFLHLRTVQGLLENSAVLVFGPQTISWPHPAVLGVSALVHFGTAAVWGVLFAWIWPPLNRFHVESTLAALFYGIFAWVIMHNVILALFSPVPPEYTTYTVLNGFISHTFAFSVPVALIVKRWMR